MRRLSKSLVPSLGRRNSKASKKNVNDSAGAAPVAGSGGVDLRPNLQDIAAELEEDEQVIVASSSAAAAPSKQPPEEPAAPSSPTTRGDIPAGWPADGSPGEPPDDDDVRVMTPTAAAEKAAPSSEEPYGALPPGAASPMTLSAVTTLPDGYTFLRVNVNLRGGRLGVGLDAQFVVTELLPGGPAELAGIEVEDQLVEVNGVSVFATDKNLSDLMPPDPSMPLILGMRRPPPLSPDAPSPAGKSRASTAAKRRMQKAAEKEAKAAAPVAEAEAVSPAQLELWANHLESRYGAPLTVKLQQTSSTDTLGVNVEYMHETHGLPEVTSIDNEGMVKRSGKISVGDVITLVNGVDVALGPDALVKALGAAVSELTIVVRQPLVPLDAAAASPDVLVRETAPATPVPVEPPTPTPAEEASPSSAADVPTPLPPPGLSPVQAPSAEPPASSIIPSLMQRRRSSKVDEDPVQAMSSWRGSSLYEEAKVEAKRAMDEEGKQPKRPSKTPRYEGAPQAAQPGTDTDGKESSDAPEVASAPLPAFAAARAKFGGGGSGGGGDGSSGRPAASTRDLLADFVPAAAAPSPPPSKLNAPPPPARRTPSFPSFPAPPARSSPAPAEPPARTSLPKAERKASFPNPPTASSSAETPGGVAMSPIPDATKVPSFPRMPGRRIGSFGKRESWSKRAGLHAVQPDNEEEDEENAAPGSPDLPPPSALPPPPPARKSSFPKPAATATAPPAEMEPLFAAPGTAIARSPLKESSSSPALGVASPARATTSDRPPPLREMRTLSINLEAEGSTTSYKSMMEQGRAANEQGAVMRAREIFLECWELSGRYHAAVSAANMALKLGDIAKASNEYAGLFERYGNMMPEDLIMHIRRKAEQARLQLEGLPVHDHETAMALRRLQAASHGQAELASRASSSSEDVRYRHLVSTAFRLNDVGEYAQAREAFLEVYCAKGRLEARLSAANMTYKLGEVAAAVVEYEHLETCAEGMTQRGRDVLTVKAHEARQRLAAAPPTGRPVRMRTLRVRENMGYGVYRNAVHLVAIETQGAATAAAEAGATAAAAAAGASASGVAAKETEDDARLRVANEVAAKVVAAAIFEALGPDEQAKVVVDEVVAEAMAMAERSEGQDEWVVVSREEAKDAAVAAAAAAAATASAEESDAELRRVYTECLRRGQAANKSGDYGTARAAFLEAYQMAGRAEALVSAINMRLKSMEVKEAVKEYEYVLLYNEGRPGFLSATTLEVVQRKIADAREMLKLMAREGGMGGVGGVGDPAAPTGNSPLRTGQGEEGGEERGDGGGEGEPTTSSTQPQAHNAVLGFLHRLFTMGDDHDLSSHGFDAPVGWCGGRRSQPPPDADSPRSPPPPTPPASFQQERNIWKEGLDATANGVQQGLDSIGSATKQTLELTGNAAKKVIEPIKPGLDHMGNSLKDLGNKTRESLTKMWL